MTGNTKEVKSNQTEIHRDLKELVLRYLQNEYRRPIAEHTIDAFHKADLFISAFKTPVVLDSGCGTGLSTIALAKQFPENPVLGIDKSEIRLAKAHNRSENGISIPDNVFYVRAELLDFWRLVLNAKWNIQFHALFYPNPWPKKSEVRYRFHGHPIFPTLVKLSPQLELRTNWKIYADEFRFALETTCKQKKWQAHIHEENFLPNAPISAFEKKFIESGHTLWRVTFDRIIGH